MGDAFAALRSDPDRERVKNVGLSPDEEAGRGLVLLERHLRHALSRFDVMILYCWHTILSYAPTHSVNTLTHSEAVGR